MLVRPSGDPQPNHGSDLSHQGIRGRYHGWLWSRGRDDRLGVLAWRSRILSSQYIGAGYVDVLAFGVMLAVLLLRPQGLFGRRVGI